METECLNNEATQSITAFEKQECHKTTVRTTSNWEIDNNKNFNDCISTVSILQVPERYIL